MNIMHLVAMTRGRYWHALRPNVEQAAAALGTTIEQLGDAVTCEGDVCTLDTESPTWRLLIRQLRPDRFPAEPLAEIWLRLHRLSYHPISDPYLVLAALYGATAKVPKLCGCAEHAADRLSRLPPPLHDREAFEHWLVDWHNEVRHRQNKPTLTYAQAREVNAVEPPADGPPAIWVAGYPGLVGGAGPELLHMIRLWRANGVDVHLVPMTPPDAAMRVHMDRLGCFTHAYRPDIFNGRTVASWCNDVFLKKLPEIAAAGRPKCVVWANCMTWTFPDEIAAHKAGLIDVFLFQSDYQRAILRPQLERHGPVRELEGFRAYFDVDDTTQDVRFEYRDPAEAGHFAVGRISRADPAKFAPDFWQTFAAVRSPLPVKAFVLGYSDQVEAKTGVPPAGLDYLWWTPGAVTTASVLSRLHCLIHHTGGSRENWPRVVLEAMAAGVPVVTERAYGLPEMIEDGVSGYLCDSAEEMAECASELAHDEPKRLRMIYAARERLAMLTDPAACWRPWEGLLGKTSRLAG